MVKATCTVCGKEFSNKSGLESHKNRKNPCKAPIQLIQTNVHQALEEAGALHLEVPINEFRQSSVQFHSSITKEKRSEQGIYFTPKKVRDRVFVILSELGVNPKTILEPSFGSGEFLLDSKRHYPQATILGIEKNEALFNSVKCPGSTLTCGDFLDWKGSAELIIGNPPYFVIKKECMTAKDKKEFDETYSEALTGRANMYILFLYKCLKEHLEENGFLAFILPTSLYNCSYYQPMRNYIQKYTTIRHLETLVKPGFHDTNQETTLLILEKKKVNDDYIFKSKYNTIYISPYYKELYTYTKDMKTLQELGLAVKTGNIVWNQIKNDLHDSEGTLLIYSSNIQNSQLTLHNLCGNEKKQYVKKSTKPKLNGPVILVERGYGNIFHFNYLLVTLKDFYAENHLNVIYPKSPDSEKNLEKVLQSFQDERCLKFVECFLGNGSFSATELETILPILV
jgi:adenine-specific DNA-methyltransferase